MSLEGLFQQYVQHGRFLRGWSPKTVTIYERCFSNFQTALREAGPSTSVGTESGQSAAVAALTKARLETWVAWMRQQNRSATYINIHIRALNAFLHWAHDDGYLPARLSLRKVPNPPQQLKAVTDREVALLLAFRPRIRNEYRTWTLLLLLLDTGIRIEEALTLKGSDIDMESLVFRVHGKGGKSRVVPFSRELRKHLFRLGQAKLKAGMASPTFFCTRSGSALSYRNTYRDLKHLCRKAGVEGEHIHPHAFRHKFAVTYIRRGGDIYRLSRILGHASLTTTQIYLRSMGVEEIGEKHSALTPLARLV
jgi:integrase/recombinase XerD